MQSEKICERTFRKVNINWINYSYDVMSTIYRIIFKENNVKIV